MATANALKVDMTNYGRRTVPSFDQTIDAQHVLAWEFDSFNICWVAKYDDHAVYTARCRRMPDARHLDAAQLQFYVWSASKAERDFRERVLRCPISMEQYNAMVDIVKYAKTQKGKKDLLYSAAIVDDYIKEVKNG